MKQKTKEDQSIDILKRVAKRVEEAAIDMNDIKNDIKFVDIRLNNVEHNTKMMKVDMEKMRDEMGGVKKDIKEIKKDTEGLIETTTHILKQAVTLDEHNAISPNASQPLNKVKPLDRIS